jgi:site-specific recombinase XerD
VQFGSFKNGRFRPPKGRKGEQKKRTVHLFGVALEAMRTWLTILPDYAPKNPKRLVFPTERGCLRVKPPRSWKKVVEAFGVVPRIGENVRWHLLRHTCASSLVSGWWGMRWLLQDASKVLGHTDVRTTQIYAHLAPQVIAETAERARAAYAGRCHGVVTAQRPAARSEPQVIDIVGHAR